MHYRREGLRGREGKDRESDRNSRRERDLERERE